MVPGPRERALADHLASCEECSLAARFEETLALVGAELHEAPVPRVDIAARVMAVVREAPASRAEAPLGKVGLAAAAAALVVGGFLWLTFSSGPAAGEIVLAGRALFSSVLGVKGPIVTVLSAFLTVLRLVGTALAELLWSVAPVAQATAIFALGVIGTITTLLLGRELRAAPVVKER